MKFATNQRAPKGNIVMHCGGPGSVSGCGIGMGSENSIGKENVANYNVIGIDQRGLGCSWPSLYHEECNDDDYADLVPDDEGKYNAAYIQEFLDEQKDFVEGCCTCTDCDYLFNNIEQPDGDDRSFHFLEYSGTRQLAEDLNRFRVLIDAPALSLYGVSYGTTVMGTYATFFPNNVDTFILDGSATPYNTMEHFGRSAAVGYQLRYNYLKYTCWAARLKNRDSCPVEPDDIAKCAVNAGYLMDLIKNSDSLTEEELNELPISVSDIPDIVKEFSTKANSPIDFLLLIITEDPSTMGKLCSTDNADWDTLNEFIENFDSPQKRGIGLDSIDCDNYDQPSYEDPKFKNYGICFKPNYTITVMVRGQGYSGGVSAYNDDVFINHVLAFQDEYGSEYAYPIDAYIEVLATNYYWPKNIPLPILGSPLVNGIITGQLYDRATPYAWTSEMREHFPSTSLLTSQSIFHGINNDRNPYGPCQKYVTKYLETGVIDWTDGTVCGQQFPYFGGEIRK